MSNSPDNNLISLMTLSEKASLQTGKGAWHTADVKRLQIGSVTVSDGPMGLRKERNGNTLPSVCFPSIAKLACSFDTSLLTRVGAAIGEQCRAEGVNVLLAPGVNIKRNPRCGRNFEYFSEDPLLTAELANAYIAGVHSQGVGVCLKHFAANNQEYGRMVCDSVIDDRALREIYLNAFERVVKQSRPEMVMCSYNRLNGEYCSQNKWLITDVLRDEWGYQGVVVSDWGAVDDRVKGIEAGLDLEMPQGDATAVEQAVNGGTLDESLLNRSVERVLALENQYREVASRTADYDAQRKLAKEASAACTVLVKNNCDLLPLDKKDNIAVFGALADKPVYQGEGSAHVNAFESDSLIAALKSANIDYTYAAGYTSLNETNEEMLNEARAVASTCDKAIVIVGGRPDSEGWDRTSWTLPECQLALIDAVTSCNCNVVIVLQCGSSVDVSFVHSAKAMLIDYYGGQCGGQALFDVLFADALPSGRLAETWYAYLPEFAESFSQDYSRALYNESIFVGYRYTSTANVPVAFPFGYGMNYSCIKWSKPTVSSKDAKDKSKITFSITLQNTGGKTDYEVVQVYATNLDSRLFREKKRLVGFAKVKLKAGEKKVVNVTVPVQELAYYDVNNKCMTVNGGKYLFTIGKDSADDRFVTEYELKGDNDTVDLSDKFPCYYAVDDGFKPSDKEFLDLYGRELAEKSATVNVSSALSDIGKSFTAKIFTNKLTRNMNAEVKRNTLAMPLRAFVSDSLSKEMLNTIIDMLNGVVIKNLFKLFKQYLACRKARKIKEKSKKEGDKK